MSDPAPQHSPAPPFPQARRHGAKSAPAAVAPTTSAALALAANPGRVSALFVNNGSQVIYLGADATVTGANGIPLPAGGAFEDADSSDAWFAIVASGTGDLRVVEVS